MNLTAQIAKQLRDFHFGGNWTDSSLQEHLADITWIQATTQLYSFNTIATLVFHMNYYLLAVSNRIKGGSREEKHELSFNTPVIQSQADWESLMGKTWKDAEEFAKLIEEKPEALLWERVSQADGNYYRNIQGVIEHNYYHLGQIVLLKKILGKTV